ncbi:hypothetical protein BTJ39_02835 [Izhakiella australiensis]|uniref:Uncharacterized protein n=1 Tax=Izhakiella australiensis TaxID=1926881 RepID=A0A1S8YTE6_9GAMM|nr:hypothetical protein BTJ39_02835 [Izhakiella australiensis]
MQVCGKRHPFLIDEGVGCGFVATVVIFRLKATVRLPAFSLAQIGLYFSLKAMKKLTGEEKARLISAGSRPGMAVRQATRMCLCRCGKQPGLL